MKQCFKKYFKRDLLEKWKKYHDFDDGAAIRLSLQTQTKTLTYCGYLLKTISNTLNLNCDQEIFRKIKKQIMSKANLTPHSCYLLCKYLQYFQFQGDETKILQKIANYINIAPDLSEETIQQYKSLAGQKALGPVNFIQLSDVTNAKKRRNALANKTQAKSTLFSNINIDIEKKLATFNLKEDNKQLKIVGIKTLKKNQMSKVQYNSKSENLLSDQLFNLKNSIKNLECVMIEFDQEEKSQNFDFSDYIRKLSKQEMDNFVDRTATQGISYEKSGYINFKQSVILHLTKKKNFLIFHNKEKHLKSIYLNQRYTIKILRQYFGYMRHLFFLYQMNYAYQKLTLLCPKNEAKQCSFTNNFQSMYDLDKKFTNFSEFNLVNPERILAETIFQIISKQQFSRYGLIVSEDKFDFLVDQFISFMPCQKYPEEIPTTEQNLHRLAIIESLVVKDKRQKKPLISQSKLPYQYEGISRIYKQLLFPFSLKCENQNNYD